MSKIDELEDFHPLSRQEWRDWLAKNHAESKGIWFVYFKKSSGKLRVAYDEAVEEALCFGWIDSLPRKIDDERAKLLFTPRKPKSVWSQLNKTRIGRLIENGLMTESGLVKIETARINGSWNALDASDNLEIAEDLADALNENHEARKNFDAFSKSSKKAVLQWLNSTKQTETRKNRIVKLVAMAANNKRANFDKE